MKKLNWKKTLAQYGTLAVLFGILLGGGHLWYKKEQLISFIQGDVRQELAMNREEVKRLGKELSKLRNEIVREAYDIEEMSVTAYTPKSGTVAALGNKSRVGLSAAVSRDMLHLLGATVYVGCPAGGPSVGLRVIDSVTAEKDAKGNPIVNTLDIYVPDQKTAVEFGRNRCVVKRLDK